MNGREYDLFMEGFSQIMHDISRIATALEATTPSESASRRIGDLADKFWQEGEQGVRWDGKAVSARLHELRQELEAADPASRVAELEAEVRSLKEELAFSEGMNEAKGRAEGREELAEEVRALLQAACAALEVRDE